MPSEREQRRADGIEAIRAEIMAWASGPATETVPIEFDDLAERLFDLRPAYCPYDCSGCHDDECPCSNCVPEADQ